MKSKPGEIKGNRCSKACKSIGKTSGRRKAMPKTVELEIIQAMDRCKKNVELLRSKREVDQRKLHQPFDL